MPQRSTLLAIVLIVVGQLLVNRSALLPYLPSTVSSILDPSSSSSSPAAMAALGVGDEFPAGVTFMYVPFEEEKSEILACGIPQPFNASKEFADKKVILFAVPGAFTPSCSARHLPGFIENLDKIKAKGVDLLVVIAYNDPFVMSAWGKANGQKADGILFMTDPETKFSKSIGWTLGERTGRYALVIDHGKVTYAEKEEKGSDVSVSGAEAVLAKL